MYKKKRMQGFSFLPTLLFTLAVCLCCWVVGYYFPADYPPPSAPAMPLWTYMSDWLPDRLTTYVIGALLLCGMALLLQRANYYLVLIRGKTTLPFLLFLLLNSTSYGYMPLRPISVAFFFLALCMVELFRGQEKEMAPGRAYTAVMYLCLGGLVWAPLLWFIPLFWYGMYQFRLLNFRNIIATVLAIFTTGWILFGWCAWKHDYSIFTDVIQRLCAITPFSLSELLEIKPWLSPIAAFLMLLFLITCFRFQETYTEGMRTRRFVAFLLTCGRYVIPLLFFYPSHCADFMYVFYAPVSLLTAYLLSNTTGKRAFLYYYLVMAVPFILLLLHTAWEQ
jgi:hypothetical protein